MTVQNSITVVNNGPPVEASVTQEDDGLGGVRTRVALESMTVAGADSPRARQRLGLPLPIRRNG